MMNTKDNPEVEVKSLDNGTLTVKPSSPGPRMLKDISSIVEKIPGIETSTVSLSPVGLTKDNVLDAWALTWKWYGSLPDGIWNKISLELDLAHNSINVLPVNDESYKFAYNFVGSLSEKYMTRTNNIAIAPRCVF